MRAHIIFCLSLALTSAACGTSSDQRSFTLQGQVLSLDTARKTVVVKHEEIKGFMPAMTMPYKVLDAKEFTAVAPGDVIDATLVVVSNDAYLKDVKKVGQAPLEKPAGDAAAGQGGGSRGNNSSIPGYSSI